MFCYVKASFPELDDCYYFDLFKTRLVRVLIDPDIDCRSKEPCNLAFAINQAIACISNRLKVKKLSRHFQSAKFDLVIDEEFASFFIKTKEFKNYSMRNGVSPQVFPPYFLGVNVIQTDSIPDLDPDREARRLVFGIPEDAC